MKHVLFLLFHQLPIPEFIACTRGWWTSAANTTCGSSRAWPRHRSRWLRSTPPRSCSRLRSCSRPRCCSRPPWGCDPSWTRSPCATSKTCWAGWRRTSGAWTTASGDPTCPAWSPSWAATAASTCLWTSSAPRSRGPELTRWQLFFLMFFCCFF